MNVHFDSLNKTEFSFDFVYSGTVLKFNVEIKQLFGLGRFDCGTQKSCMVMGDRMCTECIGGQGLWLADSELKLRH